MSKNDKISFSQISGRLLDIPQLYWSTGKRPYPLCTCDAICLQKNWRYQAIFYTRTQVFNKFFCHQIYTYIQGLKSSSKISSEGSINFVVGICILPWVLEAWIHFPVGDISSRPNVSTIYKTRSTLQNKDICDKHICRQGRGAKLQTDAVECITRPLFQGRKGCFVFMLVVFLCI